MTLNKGDMVTTKLTNLQLELIQTFSYTLPDEQMIEIRQLLAKYFLDKADAEMDRLWQENAWDENTIDEWAKGHDRTPYKPQA
ncbi:hypothetical protein CLV58_105168 [Spirosoma oryzae]|uniref:Uncharacterized protein n=2 Tax=Spirosoma oryzae TaxID=1469603 RepID=A0A2T0T8K5_9BACT|nr:hypothetical protein CLV58_105168 [Spirosoma oryzae]